MLGPAVDAIKAHLAAGFTAWPVLVADEGFDPSVQLDTAGKPIDSSGNKVPWIELRIVGGKNQMRGVGLPGQRLFVHPGIIYLHLAAPDGTAPADVRAKADQLSTLFERRQFGSTVRTEDASTNAGIAGFTDGEYTVTSVSIPFDFSYQG